MRILNLTLIGLGICLTASSADAQLKWNRLTADLHPSIDAIEVPCEFEFSNSGSYPIKIVEVKPVCACTAATADKGEYQPGEKGKIKASFTVGERVGLQSKTIVVRTDDKSSNEVELTINVTIPELLKMNPRVLLWDVGSTAQPKSIQLDASQDFPVKVTAIQVIGNRIFTQLQEIEPGKSYRITVVPKNLSLAYTALIKIDIQYGEGKTKTLKAFAQVGE